MTESSAVPPTVTGTWRSASFTKGFLCTFSCQEEWLPDVLTLRDLPCDEANGRDGSALLSMGLDLYVVKGDDGFFAERMSSYFGFHEFRRAWAQLLGFDLEGMQGFGGTRPWTTEPLQCFFDHSDCDGEISWQDAEQILAEARKDAPRLLNYNWAFSVLIR